MADSPYALDIWHPIMHPIMQTSCSFNFDDIKIVETGSSDEQIRFIESILLKHDEQTLNTQERSIKLNVVYCGDTV